MSGKDMHESILNAVRTAGKTIAVSGLILVASFGGLFDFHFILFLPWLFSISY